MSTNYYFKIKGIDSQITSIDNQLHIGKRSYGWKPLFQHTEYYQSVSDIRKFYADNKQHLTIINEYNNELTFEELEKELFKWSNDRNNKEHISNDIYLDLEENEFCKNNFS